MSRFYITLILILISSNILNAKLISGKVALNDDGTSVIGASIVVKGTNMGTITDINGNYRIEVDASHTTLEFRYLGCKSQERIIGKDSIINVMMIEDDIVLEELILTAYTQRGQTIFGIKQDTINIKVNKFKIFKKNKSIVHRSTYIAGRKESQVLGVEKYWLSDMRKSNTFKYIYDNINYPDLSVRNGVQGRMLVRIITIYDLTGNVYTHNVNNLTDNVKDAEILIGFDELINQEVLSVLQSVLQMSQYEINDKPKKRFGTFSFILPIVFRVVEIG